MEYRSPLGYNFKLEHSLSAVKDSGNPEISQGNEHSSSNNLGLKRNFTDNDKQQSFSDNRTPRNQFKSLNSRNSHYNASPNFRYDNEYYRSNNGRNSYFDGTPRGQRGSNNSGSPNPRHCHDRNVNIHDYFHPSMLEDPWRELEYKLKSTLQGNKQ